MSAVRAPGAPSAGGSERSAAAAAAAAQRHFAHRPSLATTCVSVQVADGVAVAVAVAAGGGASRRHTVAAAPVTVRAAGFAAPLRAEQRSDAFLPGRRRGVEVRSRSRVLGGGVLPAAPRAPPEHQLLPGAPPGQGNLLLGAAQFD